MASTERETASEMVLWYREINGRRHRFSVIRRYGHVRDVEMTAWAQSAEGRWSRVHTIVLPMKEN